MASYSTFEKTTFKNPLLQWKIDILIALSYLFWPKLPLHKIKEE